MIGLPGETLTGLTRLEPISAGDHIDNGQASTTRTPPTTRQVASWTASPPWRGEENYAGVPAGAASRPWRKKSDQEG